MSVEFSVLYTHGVRTVGLASERDAQALADKYQGATVEWRTTWQPLAASSVSAGAGDFGIVPDTSEPDPQGMGIRPSAGAGQVPADTIEKALAVLYQTCPKDVANVCDEILDRSGALLGRVRALAAVRTPEEQT